MLSRVSQKQTHLISFTAVKPKILETTIQEQLLEKTVRYIEKDGQRLCEVSLSKNGQPLFAHIRGHIRELTPGKGKTEKEALSDFGKELYPGSFLGRGESTYAWGERTNCLKSVSNPNIKRYTQHIRQAALNVVAVVTPRKRPLGQEMHEFITGLMQLSFEKRGK